jgi:hypothetical protein
MTSLEGKHADRVSPLMTAGEIAYYLRRHPETMSTAEAQRPFETQWPTSRIVPGQYVLRPFDPRHALTDMVIEKAV